MSLQQTVHAHMAITGVQQGASVSLSLMCAMAKTVPYMIVLGTLMKLDVKLQVCI